jgi:AraC family transcriptional regulator
MFVMGLRLFHFYAQHEYGPVPLDIEEIAVGLLCSGRWLMNPRKSPPRICRVLDRLDSDPSTPAGPIECARLADVHPVYLARIFRKAMGMSLGEYHRLARLRLAITLLTSSHLSISRVASDSGYADQSHLTHTLARLTGFTPTALRCSWSLHGQVPQIQDSRLR